MFTDHVALVVFALLALLEERPASNPEGRPKKAPRRLSLWISRAPSAADFSA